MSGEASCYRYAFDVELFSWANASINRAQSRSTIVKVGDDARRRCAGDDTDADDLLDGVLSLSVSTSTSTSKRVSPSLALTLRVNSVNRYVNKVTLVTHATASVTDLHHFTLPFLLETSLYKMDNSPTSVLPVPFGEEIRPY